MLSSVLSHVDKLNIEELRTLNRSVCNAIRARHQEALARMALKFEKGARVLHQGQVYSVERTEGKYIITTNGRAVAMTQCRMMSKN